MQITKTRFISLLALVFLLGILVSSYLPKGIGSLAISEEKPRYVVRAKDAPIYTKAELKVRAKSLLDEGTVGAKEAYVGLITALPGAKEPNHIHEKEALFVYILSGKGQITIAGKTYPIEKETAIYIPPAVEHFFENTGSTPVEAIQVFVPPGPEKKLKEWERVSE